MFVDAMDMLSLVSWRATCKANYHQACSSLRRYLATLLRPFVPCPHFLIDLVTTSHAVFGGEFALAFVLRDSSYLPTNVDIYAGDFEFDAICDAILDNASIRGIIDNHTYANNTPFDALRQLISCTLTIRTSTGKTIYVHRSYTTSASAPVTRASCTALSNFVTAYSFGCSHPRLTLNRRALIADLDFPYLTAVQHASHDALLKRRFSLAVSPGSWPEYRLRRQAGRHDASLNTPAELEGQDAGGASRTGSRDTALDCWRHRYVCPSQGRFFGDHGSFVDFIDPLGGDEVRCEATGLAPFGPMLVWRILSSFECDDGCDFDDILEEGLTSIPVLIKKDPRGELRDVVSDRYMGDFGRARSS